MRTIALLTSVWVTHECDITLLPAVLVLGNTRVHIHSPNCYNVIAYIKAPINKMFCIHTIYKSQMLTHTTTMLDFGETLITWGHDDRTILSKMWVLLIILLTISDEMRRLVSSMK